MKNLIFGIAIFAACLSEAAWVADGKINQGRTSHAGCVVDGKAYAFGGNLESSWTNLNTIEAYDLDSHTAVFGTPQPDYYLEELTGTAFDGKFYVFGGYGRESGSHESMDQNISLCYNPATKFWTTLATRPDNGSLNGCALVYGNEIFLFGGDDSTKIHAYNPSLDSWRYVTDIPPSISAFFPGFACVGNLAYLIGGYNTDTDQFINSVATYNFDTGAWVSNATAPVPAPARAMSLQHALPVIDGKIYCVGGYVAGNGIELTDAVSVYDTVTDSWATGPDLPYVLGGYCALQDGGSIYVVGGTIEIEGGPEGDDVSTNAVLRLDLVTGQTYALDVQSGNGDGSYTNGAVVPVSADVAEGLQFTYWTVDPAGYADNLTDTNSATTELLMPSSDITLIANYACQLEVLSGSGGGFYASNTLVSIVANEPETNSFLSHWSVSPSEYINCLSETSNYSHVTFLMPPTNVVLTANYAHELIVNDRSYGYFTSNETIQISHYIENINPHLDLGFSRWAANPTGYTENLGNIYDHITSFKMPNEEVHLTGTIGVETLYVATNGNDTASGRSWTKAKSTIQAAINESWDGDEIIVSNGTYLINEEISVFYDIELRGETGNPSDVVVQRAAIGDAAPQHRIFYMPVGLLSGMTITNGYSEKGGGIHGSNGGVGGVVSNCVISGNLATDHGGGVYNVRTLYDCVLMGNVEGGACNYLISGMLLSNCTVSENFGDGVSGGTLIDCNVSDNTGYGVQGCGLTNCTVTGNLGGGCVDSELLNCVVAGNFGNIGGASRSSLVNCTVIGNFGDEIGGCYGCGTIDNCIVFDNVSSNLHISGKQDIVNLYGPDLGPFIRFTCSPDAPNSDGNITNKAWLVDSGSGYGTNHIAGDYRLKSMSPCINAGANLYVNGETDLAGNPRIELGRVDMGAYEYVLAGNESFLSVSNGSGGAVYTNGQIANISADPAASGYRFSHWSVEPPEYLENLGNATDIQTTFLVPPAEVTLTAHYEPLPTYVIDTIKRLHGMISPQDPSVMHGEDQTFTITPDAGYHIYSLRVDGSPVQLASSYTFYDVQSAHTIKARFALDVLDTEPTVRNIHAQQQSGSKFVIISYELEDKDGDAATISLKVTDGGIEIPATTFSPNSNIGGSVLCGDIKRIEWDAGKDWNGHISSNVVFEVTAVDSAFSDSIVVDTRDTGKPTIYLSGNYFTPNSHAYFLQGPSVSETAVAEVDWNGTTPGKIVFRSLVTDLQEGASETYSLNPGAWSIGKRLQVYVESAEGIRSEMCWANFDVIPRPAFLPSSVIQFYEHSRGYEYQVNALLPLSEFVGSLGGDAEDMPAFGGGAVATDLLVPFKCSIQPDGSAFEKKSLNMEGVGFGFSIGDDVNFWPEFRYESLLAYQPGLGRWRAESSVEFGGALELSIFEYQSIYWTPTFVPIPIPYGLDVSLSADLVGGLELRSWEDYYSPHFNGTLDLGLSAEVFVYVGGDIEAIDFTLKGGIAGSVEAFTQLQFPDEPHLSELGFGAEIALKGVYNDESVSWVIWEGKAYLVGGPEHAPMAMASLSAGEQDDFYAMFAPMERDYLLASALIGSIAPHVVETNIHPYSECELGAIGETERLLVWVQDDAGRMAINRSELVWQSGSNGVWTTAVPIDDDGTGDYSPTLSASLSSFAACSWENQKRVRTEDSGLADSLVNTEIAVGVFDGVHWVTTNLTDNSMLDRYPRISASSNRTAVVTWIQNSHTNFIGSMDEPNRIMASVYDGTSWSNPEQIAQVGLLTRYSVAYDGNNAVVICAIDLDDDLATVDDHELFSLVMNSGSWDGLSQMTTNSVKDTSPQLVVNEKGIILSWVQDGFLKVSEGLVLSNSVAVLNTDDYSGSAGARIVAGQGEELGFVWQGRDVDRQSNPFFIHYDEMSSAWSYPVALLSNSNLLEKSFSGMLGGNSLEMAWIQTELVTGADGHLGEGRTDLCHTQLVCGVDIAVTGISFSTNVPSPGSTVDVSVTVCNLGELACSNLVVTVYEGDPDAGGVLIGSTNISGWFIGGAETNVSVAWDVPAETTSPQIYAIATTAGLRADKDETNNEFIQEVLGVDFSMDSIRVMNGFDDTVIILATVQNSGSLAYTNGVGVNFCLNSPSGTVIGVDTVYPAASGSEYDASVEWDLSALTFTSAFETVYVVLDPADNISELDESDNSSFVMVMTTLDSDGDGLLDGEEIRFGTSIGSADSDNDGLDDIDELTTHGTNPSNPDTDLDGMNDGREIVAGTAPDDATSCFRVATPQTIDGKHLLQWNTVSGHVYSVYRSTNLLSGFQCVETNIPWTRTSFTNTTDNPSSFYKIGVTAEDEE